MKGLAFGVFSSVALLSAPVHAQLLEPDNSESQFHAYSIATQRCSKPLPTPSQLPVFAVEDGDLSLSQLAVTYYDSHTVAYNQGVAVGTMDLYHREVLPSVSVAWSMGMLDSNSGILAVRQSVIAGLYDGGYGTTYLTGVLSEWTEGSPSAPNYRTKITILSSHESDADAVLQAAAYAMEFNANAEIFLAEHSVTPPSPTDDTLIPVPSYLPGRTRNLNLPTGSVCDFLMSDYLVGPGFTHNINIQATCIPTLCQTGEPCWSVVPTPLGVQDTWIGRIEVEILSTNYSKVEEAPPGPEGDSWCCIVTYRISECFGIFGARIVRQSWTFSCEKCVCCCPSN